jgi:hypothetical protein
VGGRERSTWRKEGKTYERGEREEEGRQGGEKDFRKEERMDG